MKSNVTEERIDLLFIRRKLVRLIHIEKRTKFHRDPNRVKFFNMKVGRAFDSCKKIQENYDKSLGKQKNYFCLETLFDQ